MIVEGEWSRKVDDIVSRREGLPLHGFLCFFPCDPIVNSFKFILGSDLVRVQRWHGRLCMLPAASQHRYRSRSQSHHHPRYLLSLA